MDDPQTPTPPAPPESVPWWRRVAEIAGLDDEIDAVTGAATSARDWIQSKLPSPSAAQAETARFDAAVKAYQAERARQGQASWDAVAAPVKRFFGNESVRQVGQGVGETLKHDYQDLWTPTPETTAMAEAAHQHITRQSDALRAALPTLPVTLHGGADFPDAATTGRHNPFRGVDATVDPLKPLDWAAAAHTNWIPNLAIDQAADMSTPLGAAANLDVPIAPALHAAAPVLAKLGVGAAHLAGVMPPGFFSRVEKITEAIPKKGIHPNKLASLLKSGASSEEVAYRGLPEFLASKGNQLISKEEYAAHLAAHPPPDITRTTLGEHANPYEAFVEQMSQKYGEGYDTATLTSAEREHQHQLWQAAGGPGGMTAGATKYSSYTLPGGENYRESLTQLSDPIAARRAALEEERHALGELVDKRSPDMSRQELDALIARHDAKQAEIDALPRPTTYQSPHFDEPNILVHARTTERTLPPAPMRSLPEIEQIIQDVVGAKRPEHIASGGPQLAVRQGLITHDEAALYGQSRGFTNYPHAPTGPRGRFVEEVQSDWNQQAKKVGYARPQPPLTRDDIEMRRIESAPNYANAYWESYDRRTGQLITRHPGQFPEHIAREEALQIGPRMTPGVPDNPFKETWPDLALKQQLLDVANRQDLSWLGFTSGKTQAARYDLSKQVSRLEYDPHGRRLSAYDHEGNSVIDEFVEPEQLDDYIGKEPADKLRTQIDAHEQRRAYERSQWSTEIDPDTGQYLIIDPNGEVVHDWAGDPERYSQEDFANHAIDERLRESDEAMQASAARDRDPYLPALTGLDLQVGGEGMHHFYDQLLPRRLEKLVKPFGGTVERGALTGRTKAAIDAEMDALHLNPPPGGEDALTNALNRLQAERNQAADDTAWIARLSPEQKAQIREKGFSLMSLLPPAVVGGAAAASQLGGDDPDHPGAGHGLLGGLSFASVAPIILGGRRPVLQLDKALKYLGKGEYALRGPILKRLADLYARGRELTPKATWGGTDAPELLHAFGYNEDLARQWARFFGSTSAGTSVPKNTQESIAALAHAIERPKVPFEPTGFTPDAKGRMRPQLSLYDTVITNAESKLGSLNENLVGREPTGPKTEAMSRFMQGQPRSPIDRHILWALGSAHDTLNESHSLLKAFMQKHEGLGGLTGRGRDQLNEHKVYSRVEQALHDAIHSLDPEQPYNPVFGDVWEGARAAKELPYAGGPIDILRTRKLLGASFLTDADRLKYALRDPSASWAAEPPPPPPRTWFDLRNREKE